MISPREISRIALRSILSNKMRSSLTMLGIVIGVTAVTIMFAVGAGANKRIQDQTSSLGSNLLLVLPGSITTGGVRSVASTPTLTLGDCEAILRECPSVGDAAPILAGTAQVVHGNLNWSTNVQGTTNSIFNVRNWTLKDGRFFIPSDFRSAAKVCFIGETIKEELFPGQNPVGRSLRIKNIPFMVIGLLGAKGPDPMGHDQDDVIFVPITTAQKRLFGTIAPGMIGTIMVQAKSMDEIEAAQEQITALLLQRHHIAKGEPYDFSIRNLAEMIESAKESTRVMSLLLASVASVSLLVGGIGIMNIMLVSVTERTREIGIRASVGATPSDIRFQFLVEALILSLCGGIVGVILGITGAEVTSKIASWPTIISPFSLLLSFSFSGIVGVFFGYYPAWKASLLKPVDALRHD